MEPCSIGYWLTTCNTSHFNELNFFSPHCQKLQKHLVSSNATNIIIANIFRGKKLKTIFETSVMLSGISGSTSVLPILD